MSFASGIGSLPQAVTSPTSPSAEATVQTNKAGDAGVANRQAVKDAENVDQANLSSAGGVVARALEGTDVRYAKVESLQQAIAAGDYSVSSSDVADKIIQGLLK